MTIKIEVTGETATAAVQDLLMLANTFTRGIAPPQVASPPTQPEQPKADVKPAEKVVDKPKTTRAKKDDKPTEPKQTDIEEKIAETTAGEKLAMPPIEDVRAALQSLAKSKGDDAVWELLSEYKAKNASTIPEEKRAEVIEKIRAQVEG